MQGWAAQEAVKELGRTGGSQQRAGPCRRQLAGLGRTGGSWQGWAANEAAGRAWKHHNMLRTHRVLGVQSPLKSWCGCCGEGPGQLFPEDAVAAVERSWAAGADSW